MIHQALEEGEIELSLSLSLSLSLTVMHVCTVQPRLSESLWPREISNHSEKQEVWITLTTPMKSILHAYMTDLLDFNLILD